MALVLNSGSFAAIETQFCASFREGLEKRQDPLREQHLVLVPSAALRKHLLRSLFDAGCGSFTAARIVSLNGLAQEILMDSLTGPYSTLEDPIYFALALQSAARKLRLQQFQAYRTAKGLLSTIRDLVDGLLTPDLMQQFLEAEPRSNIRELHQLYRGFLNKLDAQKIVNLQYATALAIPLASDWAEQKNIQAFHVYGFYDATPAQFDLMEILSRHVRSRDGLVRIYFPFVTDTNSVEHPAEYSQEFYDSMRSLTAQLGGEIYETQQTYDTASARIEKRFFTSTTGPTPAMHILSCGSPYEEAWVIAKKILQLVLQEGVRFDQIGVIARSLEPCRSAFEHVFAENQIPHSLSSQQTLCSSTAGHFIYLLVLIRQSHMNHNLVFELLCSPLLREPFSPAGMIRELLETLFITNSDDWNRLEPLADRQKKLPEIFELDEEDPRAELYRRAAAYLAELKLQIDRIPLQGRIRDYTAALMELVKKLADLRRFEEAGGLELELLLDRLEDLPLEENYVLNEFAEIFEDYLETTLAAPDFRSQDGVTVGDIMSLRGVGFDHVFVCGLNQDVWPLRTSEDPFLPDSLRRLLRETTGAGPHPKRRFETSDEELLLFALALRSARQKLYLSFQRANSDGRKQSASIYIEEAQRLAKPQTTEFPRNLEQRLAAEYLPTPHECATLVRRFSPYDVTQRFYQLPTEYVQSAFSFAEKLNSMDRTDAAPIDGILENPEELWKTFSDGKLRFSYSRIKDFVRCGFSFYCDRILKLQQSPFKPTEIPHDLTPLVMGRIAESVVKEAIPKLRPGATSIQDAVQYAESKVRRKYAPYLPKVLLDHYLVKFSKAALVLLEFLKTEDYDFAFAEVPPREYMPEILLVENDSGILNIYGIPDLLLYGRKKLIGEMKWGARNTKDTADAMFNQGELQFCFYPELERQHRQLLEPADFRYFRLNIYAELGSPTDLKEKFHALDAPSRIETTLRVFGLYPTQQEIANNFEKLKEVGRELLNGQFRILDDPNDYWSPCTHCGFILTCRRTHSATLLRAKK